MTKPRVCIVVTCDALATETLLANAEPSFCAPCLAELLSLNRDGTVGTGMRRLL